MDLVLLLGAHRTGSTAFERVLARNAGALGRAGLTYWPQDDLRQEPGFNGVFGLTRRRARDEKARAALDGLRARLAVRWQAAGAQAADGPGTTGRGTTGRGAARRSPRAVLLPEENMLGHMVANLRRAAFYPQARARLRAYARVLPAPPRRIGLGIRSYADHWVSAYRYSLPRHDLPPFASIRAALAAQPRGWRDLATDIAAVFPQAELLVWPQEALGPDLPDIAARLIGYPPEAGPLRPPARRINAGPRVGDAALIHALRRDRPGLRGPELEAALAPLREGPGVTKGTDFTPAQRRGLAQRYAQDLAELAEGHAGARLIARPQGTIAVEGTGGDARQPAHEREAG